MSSSQRGPTAVSGVFTVHAGETGNMTKTGKPHFQKSRYPITRAQRIRNALAARRRRAKKDPFDNKTDRASRAWTEKHMRVPNWRQLLAKFNTKKLQPLSEQCFLHRYDGSFQGQPCLVIPFGKCAKHEIIRGTIVEFSRRHGFRPYRNYWVRIRVSEKVVYVQDATAVYAAPEYVSRAVRQAQRVEKLKELCFDTKDLVEIADWVSSDEKLVNRRLEEIDRALERSRTRAALKKALGLD